MNTVTRLIQCSGARLQTWLRESHAKETPSGASGKSLLEVPAAAIEAMHKYIPVEVQVDALSPAAAVLCNHTEAPLNRYRHNDYYVSPGLTNGAVLRPSPKQVALLGQDFYNRSYTMAFKWPCLKDNESGNDFYERSARLAELQAELLRRGLRQAAVRAAVAKVERWERPWEVTETAERFAAEGKK